MWPAVLEGRSHVVVNSWFLFFSVPRALWASNYIFNRKNLDFWCWITNKNVENISKHVNYKHSFSSIAWKLFTGLNIIYFLQKFNPFSERIVVVEIITQLYMKRGEGSCRRLDGLPVSKGTVHVNIRKLYRILKS